MGLLSDLKHSKEEKHMKEEGAHAPTSKTPIITTTPASTVDLSSMEYPKDSPPSYTPSALTSTPPKAHLPAHGSSSHCSWPANPHAGDFKARVAQMEEDAKAEPHKKSWLKEKLNLKDPSEPEYYERRYTASGNGGDYEQASRIAMMGGGGFNH
jgi:hypothetical protein